TLPLQENCLAPAPLPARTRSTRNLVVGPIAVFSSLRPLTTKPLEAVQFFAHFPGGFSRRIVKRPIYGIAVPTRTFATTSTTPILRSFSRLPGAKRDELGYGQEFPMRKRFLGSLAVMLMGTRLVLA